MTDTPQNIAIIGAGQAGSQAAISLRQAGFDGTITILGAEPALPYQRPPLSKAYLKNELDEDRLYFRPQAAYDDLNITVLTGAPATHIDRQARTITHGPKKGQETDQRRPLPYDRLLLATGAPPRMLPLDPGNLTNLHYLRTLKDSDHLKSILTTHGRIVIVGAGYIGLEVAAVARQAGRDVTVLEMAPRVLARVASPTVSSFYETLHADAGVDIRTSTQLQKLIIQDNVVTSVTLANGEALDCAALLVGIGAVPETSLAQAAGLTIDNGIVVDEHTATSDPHIFAAGDCANFPSPRYGRRLRLESVPNAIEQAKIAAAAMLGNPKIHNALPWFWSDQYDVKLQTVGLSDGHDDHAVRGEPTSKTFSVWYFKSGQPIAVDALNDPMAFAIAKRLLEKVDKDSQNLSQAPSQAPFQALTPGQAADPSFDLKSLM